MSDIPEQFRWRSVEDELPDEDDVVLMVIANEDQSYRYVVMAAYLGHGYFREWGKTLVGDDPSHWMPLPPPPQENPND